MKRIISFLILLFLISGCVKQEPKFLIGDETLEVELLNTDGSPLGRIEVDVWKGDTKGGPPDAGYSLTGEEGVATFKVPEGEYQIGFNQITFPKNLVYPEKESIQVKKGVINRKTIILHVIGAPEQREEEPVSKKQLVALGASFEKANNPSSELVGDNVEYSYSTGTKINSIYMYLLNKGEEIETINLAESGASSKDILEKQAPRISGSAPEYITLSVGGTDMLEDVSIDEFRQNLNQIIELIKDERTTIMIATMPNLPKMRTAAFPSCKIDKLHLDIEKVTEENTIEYNEVIKETALRHNLILVDLFGVLGPEDVSDYDCMHPSVSGQEKIAQEFINSLIQ